MALAKRRERGADCSFVSSLWPALAATPKTNVMSAVLISSARSLDRLLVKARLRLKPMHAGAAALLLGAAATIWLVQGLRGGDTIAPQAGEITASVDQAPMQLGPSGFPIPRFLTLKSNKVNVRKGPSSDHAVAWVFQRKGMPVEITAEFENWRKIRDSQGEEGWILQQMLSGRRFAMAPDWNKEKSVALHDDDTTRSGTIAKMSPGAIAQIESCTGDWCYLTTDDYEGYALQTELWGVYPGEVVD
jgi:SH3-like domain-containing protein